MSTLPPTSDHERLDDMMRQIDGRFDRMDRRFQNGFDRLDQIFDRMDEGFDRMDRRLERIERTMLKRSDLYPTLMVAQLVSVGVWTVVIWGLARLGLFS